MITKRDPRSFAGAVFVALLLPSLPSSATAQLTCGGTIGPGGTFTMTADISNCSAASALTVIGPSVGD